MANVADAVVSALKGQTFARTIDPQRNWGTKDTEISTLKTLRCDVVPVRHSEADAQTRGHLTYQTEVDVVLRYKFAQDQQDECGNIPNADVDPLILLTEEIHEYLVHKTLDDDAEQGPYWRSVRLLWCPYKMDLRDRRQFTSLIRVTFETDKELP